MLKILLPKQYYCPGEPVVGTLQLETRKNINNLVAIELRLRGYEHTEWSNGDKNARNRKRVELNDQLIKIVDGSINSFLPFGNHSFNFEFVIPEQSPSSFAYKENNIIISHYLEASVKILNNRDLVARQNLRVGGIYMIDPYVPPKIGEVTKSFLFAQNEEPMLLKAQLNREVAQCGTQLMAYVDLTNSSSRTLKELQVKLKRIVEYGGKMERQTIRRITFRIAVDNGMKWKGRIPVAIPQGLDSSPTVENAQLLSCRYFISIHVNVLGAKRIAVELPFKISLFPPFLRGMDLNALLPHEIPLYEYYPFLQPFSQVDETPLSLNVDSSQLPSSLPTVTVEAPKEPVDLSGMDEAIARTKGVIDDLESIIYYSEMNQIRESADFDAKLDYESARNELVQSAEQLIEWEVGLISALPNLSTSITNAKSLAEQLVSVGYLSKQAAVMVPDVSAQIRILNASKVVAICTLRLLLSSKNKLMGGQDSDVMVQESALGLEESVRNLIDLLTMIEINTMSKKEEMENIQREIENYLITFSHPVHSFSETSGIEDIEESGRILSNRIENLISSVGVSQDGMADAMNGIKSALMSFLDAAKRTSSLNGRDINQEGIQIIEGTKNLMDSVLRASYANSSIDHEVTMVNANEIIRNITKVIGDLFPKKQPEAPTVPMMPNLASAIEQVKRAGERLTALAQEKGQLLNQEGQMGEVNLESTVESENQTIFDSSSSLAESTHQLLQLVADCNNDDVQFSGTMKKSLENSARGVSDATQALTSATQNSKDPERIEVAARNMTAAISGFVSTSMMVVASPETRDQFSKICQQIALHASSVSAAARSLAVEKNQEVAKSNRTYSNFNDQNVQKMEAFENQIKILRLEKELEQTRQDLMKNRKSILQSCPPPVEDK